MTRRSVALIALLSTISTGCIFGVDTSFCEDCVDDVDLSDSGDVDTNLPDTDTDTDLPDTDTDLPADLSLEIAGDPGPFVLGESEGSAAFTASCAPAGCEISACTLTLEGGEPWELESCGESIVLTLAELDQEGSWTLEVEAEFEEQTESTSLTFEVLHAFEAGLLGYNAGDTIAFSYSPELQSFCSRDGACEVTHRCEDEEGADLSCETLALPDDATEVTIILSACATDTNVEHCLEEQRYIFVYEDPTWVQVSAGANHSCGILDDGSLWCWGSNESGQLGVGGSGQRDIPTRVGEAAWQSVAAGGQHTCGIQIDGSLWCWGENSEAQVTATSNGAPSYNTPQRAGSAIDWVDVTAGGEHSCALTGSNTLFCWGRDHVDQLGPGPTAEGRVQVTLDGGIDTFVAVDAGAAHTCAVTENGRNGWCWGSPGSGRLDGFSTGTDTVRDVGSVISNSGFETLLITAGGAHSCATVEVSGDMKPYCWGNAISGQLGHTDSSFVAAVSNLPNAQHISAGTDHTCAIADGVAYCWGDENRGKLGHSASNTVPNAVTGGHTGWTDIAAGNEHTCGIAAGTLYCWGHNLVGQLGRGGAGGATPTEVDWAFAR